MDDKNVVIITPSYRSNNLKKHLLPSINFNYISKWIIVHDGSKVKDRVFPNHEHIIEDFNNDFLNDSGNPQRNHGLEILNKLYPSGSVFVYFLDDDNIIHPNFYIIVQNIKKGHLYTFDQVGHPIRPHRFRGNDIRPCAIDTGMFFGDFDLFREVRWIQGGGAFSDGYYIRECYSKNQDKHQYISMIASYYNKLNTEKYANVHSETCS